MYLKRLEINGFKSFAQKTSLEFLPECDIASGGKCGITAIVGPNGSGKSNVADAIRWAIGEQSSKALRGKKSEDVIFAGTDKKARLGSASVTLYFDNSDKRIPIEFAEVSITRRVFRSGESEYLINGSRVRLLDITDLLAKAGIGRDSYCVINQGMSDAVLSATPVERRTIFEDAAGVKQYQIEKERALRKLASTEENLGRVAALLVEIEPHLKSLKRQAEKASQGKELAGKLRAKQELLYGYLWKTFEAERGSVLSERDALEKQIFELDVEANTLSQEVKEASQKLENQAREDELAATLGTMQNDLNALLRDKSVLEGRLQLEAERQKEEEVVRVIPVDLEYVRRSLEEIRIANEALLEALAKAKDASDIGTLREKALAIQDKLAHLYERAGEGSVEERKTIALPAAELEASEKRVADIRRDLEKALERERLLTESIQNTEREIRESREANKTVRDQFFAKEKAWREKEALLGAQKDRLNEIKVRLARVEVREEDLQKLIREELGVEPGTLSYKGEPVERERIEREIARLKVEVEHAGTIDPMVQTEYEETSERFELLSRESEDLRQAMQSLRGVVSEMDAKIDAAFQRAFSEIKGKFNEYFRLIFGGGKAELNIVKLSRRGTAREDEEGEEESEEEEKVAVGIDIFACPPGKKITNLSMLSGGERSLTSLALLFAIIAYNPPPFAVLDEVEAALDEANSRRFGNMLRELAEHTQFVAITHNRETMAQANLLYGVTMGSDGVSQLLSMRLDQAQAQAAK